MKIAETSAGDEKGRKRADGVDKRERDKGKTIQEQVNGNQVALLRSSQEKAGGARPQKI